RAAAADDGAVVRRGRSTDAREPAKRRLQGRCGALRREAGAPLRRSLKRCFVVLDDAVAFARTGGEVLMRAFGRGGAAAQKSDLSNVVTEADLASERYIVQAIRARPPKHSIIAEETGCDLRDSDFTWVVD